MKIVVLLLITIGAVMVWGMDSPGKPGGNEKAAAASQESPFACNRTALDPVKRKRHFDELGPLLSSKILGVHELADGYEFSFPPDERTVGEVAEWVAGERSCCPFFDIAMHMEPEGGRFWLRLTGRNGTKQFLEVDGARWLNHPRITN